MKPITLTICVVALLVCTNQFRAQADEDAAMKAWVMYMTPGDVHKLLAKGDGDWNEEITLWMAPGAPPQKSTATVTNKMILGGRYQESKHMGNFMGAI